MIKNTLSRKKFLFTILITLFTVTSFYPSVLDVKATPAPSLVSPLPGRYVATTTPLLDWTDVAGNDNYNVQIATDSGFTDLEVNSVLMGMNPSEYTPSSLAEGEHYWRVRSYDSAAGGWSAFSDAWNFIVDTIAPAAPNVITPEYYGYINYDAPYVEWERDLSALKYRVEFDNTWDYSSPLDTRNTYNWYYTYPSALTDGRYYVRVRSEDFAGNIGPWTEVPFDIDTVAPPAPVLTDPYEGQVVTSFPYSFDWDASGGSYFWYLEFSRISDFSTISYSVGTNWDAGYSCTPGTTDGTYYWRVRQKDWAENLGPWSTTGSFILDRTGPTAPILVAPNINSYTTDTTPYLDWNVGGDAVEYQVVVDTSDSFLSPDIDATTSNTYHTTTTLSEGTYFWRVRGKDAYDNWGGWSSVWSFTIDTTDPDEPTLVTPDNNQYMNDNTPYLDWNLVGEPVYYDLEIDTSDSFPSPAISLSGIGNSFYQVVSSLADDTYYWRVRAIDLAGNVGLWSTVRSFTIDTVGPGTPILVSPGDTENLTDATPLILWNSVADGVEYQLEIDTAGTFISLEFNITSVNTFYSILSNLADDTYYWRVRAKDVAENWGGWSSTWSFTVDLDGPIAPDLNLPSNSEVLDDETPYLEWFIVGDADEYEIELATTDTFGTSSLFSTTTANNYYSILFTLSDGVYYWRVRARDAAENWGNWSDVWAFSIDTIDPYLSSPEDIVYEVGSTGNNITWQLQDENPSNYIVYLDGIILSSGYWNITGESVYVDVDNMLVGTYNLTIYIEDITGKSTTDTVIVTVTDIAISEFNLTVPLLLLPTIFIGLTIIFRKQKK